jgi:hypothetical protein
MLATAATVGAYKASYQLTVTVQWGVCAAVSCRLG